MRLAICQSAIPRYRIQVFELLGAQQGIELTVFAGPREDGGPAPLHFDHRPAPMRPRRLLRGLLDQPAQIEAMDPARFDLVILPWNPRYASLGPALRRARKAGVRVVLWGHGYSKRPGRLRDLRRYGLGRRADAVLLYSRTIADRLIAERRFDPARVFVAPNALDQTEILRARAAWEGAPDRLAAFRAEHDLDPQRTVIFVSRLLRENRPELLIEALARVVSDEPRARLVMVGDGPARPAVEALVAARGLGRHVHLTGAIWDEVALAPWMLSSAFFAYPVNVGLSILHAFGYGLPAITSDDVASHNPEIEALEPGRSGLCYRDGDVGDLAAQWLRLMADGALRATLGRRALELVREKYTLEKMVQGFLDVTGIVDGSRRSVGPSGEPGK